MSKGSRQRPTNHHKFAQGYEQAFRKAKGSEAQCQHVERVKMDDKWGHCELCGKDMADAQQVVQLPTEAKG